MVKGISNRANAIKNQILETYLNQVFMGGGTNIYGVEKHQNITLTNLHQS